MHSFPIMRNWVIFWSLIRALTAANAQASTCAERQCHVIERAIRAHHAEVETEYLNWSTQLASGSQLAQLNSREIALEMAKSIIRGPQVRKSSPTKARTIIQLVERCYGANFQSITGGQPVVAIKPYAQIAWAERNIDFRKLHKLCRK